MSPSVLIYLGLLFFLLSPSILVTLPSKGNKYVVAFVHAIIFVFIFYITYNYIIRSNIIEGVASQSEIDNYTFSNGCNSDGPKNCGVKMSNGDSKNCSYSQKRVNGKWINFCE